MNDKTVMGERSAAGGPQPLLVTGFLPFAYQFLTELTEFSYSFSLHCQANEEFARGGHAQDPGVDSWVKGGREDILSGRLISQLSCHNKYTQLVDSGTCKFSSSSAA